MYLADLIVFSCPGGLFAEAGSILGDGGYHHHVYFSAWRGPPTSGGSTKGICPHSEKPGPVKVGYRTEGNRNSAGVRQRGPDLRKDGSAYVATMSKTPGVIAVLCLLACLVIGSISCAEDTPVPGPLLSDYPALFHSETMIVISQNASAAVTEGAREIASRLEQLTEHEPPIETDATFAGEDKASLNLILIGTPASNAVLEQTYSLTELRGVTREYPGENKGILQILRSPWNRDRVVLMVCGSDEPGLRAAIEFLMKDEEIRKLNEQRAVMQSDNGGVVMIPVDRLNSVMDYVRQHHSDAAQFISGNISWTRTDQTFQEGYTRNVYSGDGWMVIVGLTIVPGACYDVRAEHITEAIVWTGRIENGTITETSYTSGR